MKKLNVSNDKIFYTVLSLISLGILLKTYDYLTKLEDCDCYNDVVAYNNLKINIDLLKAYQIFEMFLVFIFIAILFCGTSMKLKKKAFPLTFMSSSFSLKNLNYFIKCTNLCNQIEIYLANDLPLIVKYNVASLGAIKLGLAPIPNIV